MIQFIHKVIKMKMLKIGQKCSFFNPYTNKFIFGVVIKVNTKNEMMKIKCSNGDIHYLGS